MLFLQTDNTKEALTLFDLIMKGGPVLIPIAILLFLAIYLFIERLLALRTLSRSPKGLTEYVKKALVAGELKQATQYCETQEGALPMILHAGLQTMSAGSSIDDVEKSMESVANIAFTRITNPLTLLGLISGIAPMLGFVGTILGVIRIFYNISLSDNISIGIIAGGLYEKMITSFAGLVVGILAYTAYHFLSYLVDKQVLKVEMESLDFLTFLRQPSKV
ncbi:MAG: MotA/TolQ/ExbB proton channel family protein [Bacteroidia bacterium]|nr:MotA/TolQ/ExbB proton channel family protein [Bacteroidia bacterium]